MRTIASVSQLREGVMRAAASFSARMVERIVEADGIDRADEWIKEDGSEFLRHALGLALMLRAERRARDGACPCGARAEFKQRRPFKLHTVVPGRDVALALPYAVCPKCHVGQTPLLVQLGADAEGFTPALRELALLAAVESPYEQAAESTLPKFAGVEVSRDKLHALVHEHATPAQETMKEAVPDSRSQGLTYVGIDGGMAFVDKAWQEHKLGVLFDAADFASKGEHERGSLTARRVVGVRGDPEALASLLRPHAEALGDREAVILGDGAKWIWNLADLLFPHRTEILDWYHADEHVSAAARAIHPEDADECAKWRARQLERLMHDEVELVLNELAFLSRGKRRKSVKEAASDLHNYLAANRHRVLYKTFRDRGLRIGSGFIESAVNHVLQQRMKRTGMRWRAAGADAMLALRCVYRTTSGWERMLSRARSSRTG